MIAMRIYPKGVTPRMFLSWFDYAAHHDPEPRRMGGRPVLVSPGFPTVREPRHPEGDRGIGAVGNDRL